MPDVPEGGYKMNGSRIRLTNQPREGPRWQTQDQIMQTVQGVCRPVIKNAQVNGSR